MSYEAFGLAYVQATQAYDIYRADQSTQNLNALISKGGAMTAAVGGIVALAPGGAGARPGAVLWLGGTLAENHYNGNFDEVYLTAKYAAGQILDALKQPSYVPGISVPIPERPTWGTRTPAEYIAMGLSPEGYTLDAWSTSRADPNVRIWTKKLGDKYMYYEERGNAVIGNFESATRYTGLDGVSVLYVSIIKSTAPGTTKQVMEVGYQEQSASGNRVAVPLVPGQQQAYQPPKVPITFDTTATSVEGAPGWKLVSNSNNTAALVDDTGYAVLTQSASESLTRNAQGVFVLVRTNGTIVYYDALTKVEIGVSADGSGYVERRGEFLNFTAGNFSIDPQTGIATVVPVGGGAEQTFFGTRNDVSVQTNTSGSAQANPVSDATNAINTEGIFYSGSSGTASVLDNSSLNHGTGYFDVVSNGAGTNDVRPGNANVNPIGASIGGIAELYSDLVDYQVGGAAWTISQQAAILDGFGSGNVFVPIDPLVLDLNGDGVTLSSFAQSKALFDIDNDGGTREHTGWVSVAGSHGQLTDGIMAHDMNGDGIINNISETLSEFYGGVAGSAGMSGTRPHANGFAALRSLDSNMDNQFTAADALWGTVRIWVDDNGDGVSFKDANANGIKEQGELSELVSLDLLGITQISLAAQHESGLVNLGNEVVATGTFIREGSVQQVQSVRFVASSGGTQIINGSNGSSLVTEGGNGAIGSYVSNSKMSESLDVSLMLVDNIYAGSGDDILTGDSGANWLAGGGGSDTLDAGAGDDVLLIDGDDLSANINAGEGRDVIQVVGGGGVIVDMTLSQAEAFVGGDGDDVVVAGGRSTVFVRGGAGDDVIQGGGANDVLSGEDGRDDISGGGGNDLIRGHRGRDVLRGESGGDILDGGLEDDVVSGDDGNDVLIGGRGDDFLDGGADVDVAEYSGSFADYRISKISDASGATVFRVVDTHTGRDGADTLTNVERLSFSDVSNVNLTLGSPLPVKDILSVNSSGQALSRTTQHLISKAQLLGNDRDWDSEASQLSIMEVMEARGGIAVLTAQGDILFTPDASYTGVMSFKYRVQDAQGQYTEVSSGSTTAAMKAAVYLQTPDLPSDPLAVEQWYLSDVNVMPVWNDYTGKGVRIGQFEPGGPFSVGPEVFDYRHPDLQPNADKAWLNEVASDPLKAVTQTFSNHATMVAGVMVAARNGEGGVGVAYNASLAGHYIQGEGLEVSQLSQEITNALAKFKNYDVVNNSWGATQNFMINVVPVGALESGISDAVHNGRNALGTVIVMAGGNDREAGANTNYNALTANRAVITVGSINAPGDLGTLQAGSKPFSNPGASILVSAPGSNIDSTSRELIGENGSTFGSQYDTSQGTSFAAPIISGVVALMLEANPSLGYRDIQTILAMSATDFTDPNGTDWSYNTARNWNGGGMHKSHDYGFGKVDARAAVRLAETWYDQSTAGNEAVVSAASATLNSSIPDGSSYTASTLTLAGGLEVESAQVTLELNHSRWGDLIIELVSPTGTISKLVNRPGKQPGSGASDLGDAGSGTMNFSFNTTHVRGESSAGNWTLRVYDAATGATGVLKNWKLDLYGATADSNDVYVYTNEFADFSGTQRNTLTDSNGGGIDIVNASAVTGNSTINLNNGTSSVIAGKTVSINGNIERAYGGDGNDTLTGNGLINVLLGGRGDDTLSGGAGDDRLEGGRGSDTLTGGADNDIFVIQKDAGSSDTINDFNVNALEEKVALVGFGDGFGFSSLTLSAEGANTRVGLGNGQSLLLVGTTPAQVTEQSFVFLRDAAHLETYARFWGVEAGAIGTSAGEVAVLDEPVSNFEYYGGAGDDVIASRIASELLDGGNGNDEIYGEYTDPANGFPAIPGGNDWLEGGAGADILRAGQGDDYLAGGTGDDVLSGGTGNDVLDGGAGADYLEGGDGQDLLELDNDTGTVIAGEGAYYGTRSGGAGADVFRMTATTSTSVQATMYSNGLVSKNLISDFSIAQGDKVDLSAHADIRGFADLKFYSLTADGKTSTLVVVGQTNSISYGPGTLTLGGSALVAFTLYGVSSSQLTAEQFIFAPQAAGSQYGTTMADTLTGDAGANTLNGLAGADTMTGRTGDDTYIVDSAGDVVNELPGGGYDRIESSVSHTLAADVEGLMLTGAANLNGTGNALRNRLRGNAGNNRLDGGQEADEMTGGAGNDTYVVDNQLDAAYENVGEGTDTIESTVSWTLGNHFENLLLTGTENINATGNQQANALTGNVGDNVLDGAQGADTMAGGAGDDTYYVDSAADVVTEAADQGFDSVFTNVNIVLAENVEAAALMGTATTLTGNGLDNTLTGNGLANTLAGGGGSDVLDGGAGVDSLSGGTGDDTYVVDNSGDTVSEAAGEGNDTIISSVSWTLGTNVENLVLAGTGAINGTGNGLSNLLAGNAAANALTGGAGDDTLDGAAGADTMAGGTGDDTYRVDASGDAITESAGEGTDTVVSTADYVLGTNLENLTLGGSADTDGTGNSFDNILRGNSGANVLFGAGGADTIRGGAGNDALQGGSDGDTYVYARGDGHDTIQESEATAGITDILVFDAGIAPADVAVSRLGLDLVLTLSASESITVEGWFSGAAAKVEEVRFADGTIWNVSQLRSLSNLAPSAAAIAAQSAQEDSAWAFTVPASTFTDADFGIGDALVYSATLADGAALPAWLSFDAAARILSGTPLDGHVGALEIKIMAADAAGASASSTFMVTITNTNDVPTASSLVDGTANEDAVWSYVVPAEAFADADLDSGDVLTYSATLANGDALPAWLAFDPSTRTFSGTPADVNVGSLAVKVTATDAAGAAVSSSFTLSVTNTNDAPVAGAAIAAQSAQEDAQWTYVVPANAFSDLDADSGDTLTYSATLANGDPLPGWLNFDSQTLTFSGTPSNADVGSLNLKLTATDTSGAHASSVFTLDIANTNDSPTVGTALQDQETDEDTAWSFVVPAGTFVDADAGDSLTYSVTLADGSPLPSWLAFDGETRTFSGTPLNGDVGSLSLKVTSTDSQGASASSTFTLTVVNTNDAPVVAAALENQQAGEDSVWTFTVPAGTFGDPDAGDSLTYSATLANGDLLPSWLAFDAQTRTFSGTPLNAHVGNLSLKVTASDGSAASASSTFVLTVANSNDAPVVVSSIGNQEAAEDAAWSFVVSEGAFGDVDSGDTLTYSATLESGAALPGWLSFDAQTRTFSGTPSNTDVGGFTVKVTATDAAGASASSSFALAVANTNDAPTIVAALEDQAASEDSVWSFVVPAGTFGDVDAGDTLTYSATLGNGATLPGWLTFDAQTRTFSGTPLNANVGSLSLKVTAVDAAGTSVSSVFDLEIANTNDAPLVAHSIGDQNAPAGANWTFVVPSNTFLDDDGDALTLSASLPDGQPLPGWLSFDPLTGSFSGTPATTGALTVRVNAVDGAGSSVSTTFNLAVTPSAELNAIALEDEALSYSLPAGAFTAAGVTGSLVEYEVVLSDGRPLPSWLSFDGVTGTFSGTPLNKAVGTLEFQVTAKYSGGATVTKDFELTVQNVNDAPKTESTHQSSLLLLPGVAFTYKFAPRVLVDVDAGDSLAFTMKLSNNQPLPSWLTFDSQTLTLSGTPPVFTSPFNLRLVATDGAGAQTMVSLSLQAGAQITQTGSAASEAISATNTTYATVYGLEGNDTLNGSNGADVLYGGAGNDRLYGGYGNDTHYGGDGNDILTGSYGRDVYDGGAGSDSVIESDQLADTYIFARGYGVDTVVEGGRSVAGERDRVLLGADIAPADVTLSINMYDVILTINGTSDQLILSSYLGNDEGYSVEDIVFADGTIWTRAFILETINLQEDTSPFGGWTFASIGANTTLTGTSDRDTYYIDHEGVVIQDDSGPDYGDTARASISYVLGENFDNLALVGAADIDGVGNDRSNQISGNIGDNILNGKGGADFIDGVTGADTYLFARGDGADEIYEMLDAETDILEFKDGITADQLWFRMEGSSLEISLIGTDDKILVLDWQNQIEKFRTTDVQRTLNVAGVDALVQAMAAFAPPAAGETTLSASYRAALDSVITSSWTPGQ